MTVPGKQFMTTVGWAGQLVAALEQLPSALSEADLAVLRAQLAGLAEAPAPAATDAGLPIIVRGRRELAQLAERLAAAPAVAIDLETVGLDPRGGEVVGVGLAAAAAAYYVPTAHRFADTKDLLPDQLPPAEVAGALRLDRLPLVAHNAKFELKWLRRHASVEPRFIWDTMVAARLLRSDLPAQLKEVAVRELDVADWALPPKELARIQFLPVERVAVYCAKDARYALELYERQKKCLG
jgi:DNA polymerase-1